MSNPFAAGRSKWNRRYVSSNSRSSPSCTRGEEKHRNTKIPKVIIIRVPQSEHSDDEHSVDMPGDMRPEWSVAAVDRTLDLDAWRLDASSKRGRLVRRFGKSLTMDDCPGLC